jgi:hypothetical protein
VISSLSWSFFAISSVLHNSAGQRLDLEKQDGRVADTFSPLLKKSAFQQSVLSVAKNKKAPKTTTAVGSVVWSLYP